MLRRLEVSNYKMFQDFTIDFTEGVNLVCGQNGSGKSSLLELVHALAGFLATHETSDHVNHSVAEAFPFESFCRWGLQSLGSGDMRICVVLGNKHESFKYSLLIRYNFRDSKNRVQEEELVFQSDERNKVIISFKDGMINMITDTNKKLSFNGDWNVSGLITGARNNSQIRDFISMIAKFYALHLEPTVTMQDFKAGALTLGLKGERFSAWHFHNSTNRSENQLSVVEQSKNFIPGLVSVNSPQSGDVFRWKVRVKYNGSYYDLELRELSDGQKALFVLYSLLANIPDGSTLIIDEPENYLAPGELQPWLDAVNDAWEERDIQFILITHNPRTLNWYHKDAVIFKIKGEPPRITAERNSNNTSETLFEKLSEMEWDKDGAKSS